MNIAERITEKRIKAELSRNEVARRADLTEAYIGLLERGLRNPTVDVVERICGALGITIQEFFAVDQEIAALPPDIYAFVNKRENHESSGREACSVRSRGGRDHPRRDAAQ